MKSIFRNSAAAAFFFSLLLTPHYSVTAQSDDAFGRHTKIKINVIYPKAGQIVTATDSTFILGNVAELPKEFQNRFSINGHHVPLSSNGSFLAYIPIEPDSFVFDLKLELFPGSDHQIKETFERGGRKYDVSYMYEGGARIWTHKLKVYIPPPIKPIPLDTMIISGGYRRPRGNLTLAADDELRVSFHATPGHIAWFSIDDIVDSVPMPETNPQPQIYWGEAVFGAGEVPESLLLKGIYTGSWTVPPDARIDTAAITYHLAVPHPSEIFYQLFTTADNVYFKMLAKYAEYDSIPTIISHSAYKVTLNDPAFPFTVRYIDSVQTVRHGPRRGYQSIFQPEGVTALAIGAIGDWYKLQLSTTQTGWVNQNSVLKLEPGIRPTHSYLIVIRSESHGRKLIFEFPLSGKHPFKIIEDDRRTIRVQLFGVTTDTDWIRYDFDDDFIDVATWNQPEEDLYEFKIALNKDIWGYNTYYKGNTLFLELIKPPDNLRSLRGKVVVIDPGHSADPGSIGPSGYTEAEANLAIALKLKKKLESRGARVVMTRSDTSHVALYDRPAIAKFYGADLFVSIHNNALPDGVNPFTNNGTSIYYYHPHSINLARAIHGEMLKATQLPDHGLYHGNLAVNRPTQYPAVLIECAFMIIPEQEEMLKSERFRKRVANAITKGIEKFLKDFAKKNR
ncbi:MAG: N-acetylmuramoyl-L-alanine amidase [candidate division Zixibacteria bacterium]|nr:N-acetylmuramoyl-L-alanine amidase [candidate division Zixibacteria bacterium]